MTQEQKEKYLQEKLDEFMDWLKDQKETNNFDFEYIVNDADNQVEDSWHTTWHKSDEECLQRALANYIMDWVDSWGDNCYD